MPRQPTVSVTVAERVSPPPLPTIVRLYVPGGVLGPTVTVSIDVKGGFPALGLNEYDPPEGRPPRLRTIGCVEPLARMIVTVKEALWPCETAWLVGDAEREKSNCG